MAVPKRRLDAECVEQGLYPTVDEAARAIMAGQVSSRGERLTKPGQLVRAGIELHRKEGRRPLDSEGRAFVGRGGLKLQGALDAFGIDPAGLNCIDVGCSTGGFTDCLLRRGAAHVASVDVGSAQFDWGLRNDPRVSLFEKTNIVGAEAALLGAPFDLAVSDVSFTSIRTILPAVIGLLSERGTWCTLVKPQFEAAADQVPEGGIVADPQVHLQVLRDISEAFASAGLGVRAACVSPIHGTKGNVEYFLHGVRGSGTIEIDYGALVASAL